MIERESVRKKLTIILDAEVYSGLYKVIGRRHISRFIESLVRPYVIDTDLGDLDAGYHAMAEDEAYEAEAPEWIEGTLYDGA